MKGWSVVILLSLVSGAPASFYDWRMSLDRTSGLPPVDAIVAGKFEQHSIQYYRQVVAADRERLKVPSVGKTFVFPNTILIAPALARCGDLDAALVELDPYRNGAMISSTEYAMRGTLLLAKGEFEAAVTELQQAVKQNPRNPFARDQYELRLAKYLHSASTDPSLFRRQPTFVRALLWEARLHIEPTTQTAAPSDDAIFSRAGESSREIDEAVTAVCALIRFDDLNVAHHYAALGDLLRYRGELPLAYRAYGQAVAHGHPQPGLINEQMQAIRETMGDDPRIAEATIAEERRSAQAWVQAYQAYETKLALAGMDAQLDAYAAFYAEFGNLRDAPVSTWAKWGAVAARLWPALSVTALLLLVLLAMLARHLRRKSEPDPIIEAD